MSICGLTRRLVLSGVLMLLLATAAVAATVQWVLGPAATTILTLNSLGNGAYTAVTSTPINNVIGGGGGNGYLKCRFSLFVNFVAGPVNDNAALYLWFLESVDDGATFDTQPSGTIVTGIPSVTIPIATGTTTTRKTVTADCPQGHFHVIGQFNNTGQTTTASTNTLRLRFATPQVN